MLGPYIRDRRIGCGYKVRDVAVTAGVTAQHLRDIEAGRRQPSFQTLLSLTNLLAYPVSEWIGAYLTEESRILPLIQAGEHLLQAREVEQAAVVLRRLRSLQLVVRQDGRYQGRLYHLWGMVTYAQGLYARSLIWFQRAERAIAKSRDPLRKAEASYNVALAMMRARLLSKSVGKFDETVQLFKSIGEQRKAGYSLLTKANVLINMHSYREALPEYRRAAHFLRGDVWYFDAKLGEAICRWRTRSVDSAFALLRSLEASQTDPGRKAKCHYNQAVIYRHLGEVDKAIDHLTIALEDATSGLGPLPEALAEMCLCQILATDLSGARDTLDRFYTVDAAKDPDDILAMAIVSHVLERNPLPEPLPQYTTGSYEQRVIAAISVLHQNGMRSSYRS